MIKEFFRKKETLFILGIALISVFFIILGFLFLFFKSEYRGAPRVIPTDTESISWKGFSSKLLKQKIQYPDYMYINEQESVDGTGINIAEFKPQGFLNYFNNQNHISLYPSGMEMDLYYGKIRESEFTNSEGQVFDRVEYLTLQDEVWAIMLTPQQATNSLWQSRGFVWMQTQIKNREILCMAPTGVLISDVNCDPFGGQKIVYDGIITGQFLNFGYEIINKNSF